MAKKGKFEKLGKNESYFDTHDDKNGDKKNKTGVFKKVARRLTDENGEILNLNPQKVPEKAQESEKFTFSKNKRVSIYTEKVTPQAEKPEKAPYVLALCVFVLQFFALFALSFARLSPTGLHILKSVMYIGVYIVPVLVYIMSAKERKKKYNVRGFSPSHFTFIIACLALLLSVTALQKYYIAYTFTYSEEISVTGVNIFLALISSAVLPAICEEVFVHGIFQHEVSEYGGGLSGIIASSVVFAMLHFELQYFIIYFVSAIILGSLTHITGSCVPSVIVHMINNAAAIFLSSRMAYVAKERIGGTLLMIVLSLLSFAFLIIVLRLAQNISENRAMRAEGVSQGKAEEVDFLTSKKGRTFTRIIRSLTNPVFLICVAVFIIAVITFSEIGA